MRFAFYALAFGMLVMSAFAPIILAPFGLAAAVAAITAAAVTP